MAYNKRVIGNVFIMIIFFYVAFVYYVFMGVFWIHKVEGNNYQIL
jgi:hypothetical protein